MVWYYSFDEIMGFLRDGKASWPFKFMTASSVHHQTRRKIFRDHGDELVVIPSLWVIGAQAKHGRWTWGTGLPVFHKNDIRRLHLKAKEYAAMSVGGEEHHKSPLIRANAKVYSYAEWRDISSSKYHSYQEAAQARGRRLKWF